MSHRVQYMRGRSGSVWPCYFGNLSLSMIRFDSDKSEEESGW